MHKNPEGTCPFAHHHTGTVADPPQGYRPPYNPTTAKNDAASSLIASLKGHPTAANTFVQAPERATSPPAVAPSDRSVRFQLPEDEVTAPENRRPDFAVVFGTLEFCGDVSSARKVIEANLHLSRYAKLRKTVLSD